MTDTGRQRMRWTEGAGSVGVRTWRTGDAGKECEIKGLKKGY